MIRESHNIFIRAAPMDVYRHLEERPGKFPIFRMLESWPFLALRVFLIGHFKSGLKMLISRRFFHTARENMKRPLAIGDSFGPFTLSEAKEGEKYFFTLKTKLFDLEAGYIIKQADNGTVLSLDLISPRPALIQRAYWILTKPVHYIFARKTLAVIKYEAERTFRAAYGGE
ncbi:MAG: hypothetical protein IBX64_00780 [Actinobacteria bacterium]|nr:hypothetical protein [Actinomycetota bacterium]